MYKEITDYIKKDIYPFHMPGHKRNPLFLPPDLLSLDITELPGTDVLGSPTGIIDNLQNRIASFYDATRSFLLVNGSSAGVTAAILATCAEGAPLVIPRNAHTSVYNGLVLSGAVPVYILPEITADGLCGGITPAQLDNIPQGATVLVVSPTYEGFVSDISAIAAKVHEKNGLLIVDEAHGAHFKFSSYFPKSALECGADIVIQSMHKTLPVISQTAVLHVNSHRVDVEKLRFWINAVQTTSPSYMIMCAADYALTKLWQEPWHFENYVQNLINLRKELSGLVGEERVGENAIFAIDKGKLLFKNCTGIEDALREHKIEVEMTTDSHTLLMTSVADTKEGFDRLAVAIAKINNHEEAEKAHTHNSFTLPEVALTPRQALQKPWVEIDAKDATGKISAQIIAKYPPGIAIVAPGERIVSLPNYIKKVKVIV